jgi:hypothetical protein
MIKIKYLPFIIVMISFFIPQTLSYFISWPKVFHAPVFLSLACLILYLIRNKKSILYKTNKIFYRVLILQFIFILFGVITGRGFVVMGAGFNLFLVSFILVQFFYVGKPEPRTIIKGISLLYSVLVIALFVEFIIVILGGQTLLDQILPIYKTYNPSELLQSYGIGGLNSMLGGSQIAGMISLFSFLWFFILYRDYSHFKVIGKKVVLLLIVLSGLLYFVTMTGTTTLLAILAFILYIRYYLTSQKSKIVYFTLFLVLIFIGALLFYNDLLFSRLSTDGKMNLSPIAHSVLFDFVSSGNIFFDSMELNIYSFYAFHLFNTAFLWLNQDWGNILFGIGVKYRGMEFVSADNGFVFAVLLKTGLFGASLLLAGIWVACYKPLTIIKKTNNRLITNWSRMCVLFSINSILFLTSTIHYNQALDNAGVYPLFALLIALSIYSKMMVINLPMVPRNFRDTD